MATNLIISIIIFNNQLNNIERVLTAFDSQSVSPDAVITVCDSIHADAIKTMNFDIDIHYVDPSDISGFTAGINRDIGIDYALNSFDNIELITFSDGDCVPCFTFIESHMNEHRHKPNGLSVTCGLRDLEMRDAGVSSDTRSQFALESPRLLNTLIDSLFDTTSWSCNFAMNVTTIKHIQYINKIITGESRCFNKDFDGAWGCEDNFIGSSIYMTGGDVVLLDRASLVTHIWHEQSARKRKRIKQASIWYKNNRRLLDAINSGQIPHYIDDNEIEYIVNYLSNDIGHRDTLIKMYSRKRYSDGGEIMSTAARLDITNYMRKFIHKNYHMMRVGSELEINKLNDEPFEFIERSLF